MASSGKLSDSALLRVMRGRAVDPAASVASALFVVASILKVPERLEITASELGILIGCVCMLAATLRAMAERRA